MRLGRRRRRSGGQGALQGVHGRDPHLPAPDVPAAAGRRPRSGPIDRRARRHPQRQPAAWRRRGLRRPAETDGADRHGQTARPHQRPGGRRRPVRGRLRERAAVARRQTGQRRLGERGGRAAVRQPPARPAPRSPRGRPARRDRADAPAAGGDGECCPRSRSPGSCRSRRCRCRR